ncbi:LacI family DNA-binding transcriptional regulator [Levilactobacillus brevis]|uniref:LacI family DNA-binding transcriptional regulator n=1 Tax=Levilactobacillus brevis TaxID=1580 RepID=A0AA41EMC8_LEVBR|nr:LacI family DNA-binding transcriptional regulator [Levilactobacillus brevis]KID44803.1 Catabolite control protein A [Levilactobacillus brevis]MBS0946358.1 LacI family DNA-binding transcriptional regulator [Levilactobacillus brevis]MBS0978950.1 LacI family DNA-binding transcriptional regulator [Levilactobacillus brevis]MBS1009507.1 LacI family DNA-binding transcriptional regulator [Levilactobacillus brevis]MCU0199750.1 LacI family transcriptional regulator [Levilactobacillus brevis]
MKKRVTLADVAREAHVGIGTASRVLNDMPDVSPEKRKLVLSTMKKMNFKPNRIAQGLMSKPMKMLAVVVSDITSTFFSSIIKGIENNLPKEYGLMLFNTSLDTKRLHTALEMIYEKHADGLFFLGEHMDEITLNKLEQSHMPVVAVSSKIPFTNKKFPANFAYVSINNEQAAYLATDYLCESGHRRIALLISDIKDENVGFDRYNGYRRALLDNKIKLDSEIIFEGDLSLLSGYELTQKMINQTRNNLPTAIFAASDNAALGALRALHENNLSVPEDISIIGFDGIESTEFSTPSLTTISQPRLEMGEESVALMMKLISNDQLLERKMTLDFSFIKRESVQSKK